MKKIILAFAALAFVACGDNQGTHKGAINLGKQPSPITLAASNNDLALSVNHAAIATVIRMTPFSGGSTVTGLDASSMDDGDMLMLRNDGSSDSITLTNNDNASLARNRMLLPSGANVVIAPRTSMWIEWDATATAWVAGPGLPNAPTFAGTVTMSGPFTFPSNVTLSSTAHAKATGTAPTLTSCGSAPAPTVTGSDVSGTVVTGGTATTCTITFATTYGTTPTCVFLPAGTATQPVYTVSATAITVTTDIAQTTYNYMCWGH